MHDSADNRQGPFAKEETPRESAESWWVCCCQARTSATEKLGNGTASRGACKHEDRNDSALRMNFVSDCNSCEMTRDSSALMCLKP